MSQVLFASLISKRKLAAEEGEDERKGARCSFPVEYFSIFPILHFAAIRGCYEMKFTLGTLWHHVSKVICHSCSWIQYEWVWVCEWVCGRVLCMQMRQDLVGALFSLPACLPAWRGPVNCKILKRYAAARSHINMFAYQAAKGRSTYTQTHSPKHPHIRTYCIQ